MPDAVPEVTVTAPQFALPAAHTDGPVTLVPPGDPYAIDVAVETPSLRKVQTIVAAVGDVVGVVLLHPVRPSTGADDVTTRLTAALAAEPAGDGVAVTLPL